MSLADNIETQIRAERGKFAGLGLPEEFIAPNYDGRSIVNVPASLARILGGDLHTPPLDPSLIGKFETGIKRVVAVVVDALGYGRLRAALEADAGNGLHALLRHGAHLAPLTSVFPSTTTAALTSLWTGYTPAEHGFMGYMLYLRHFGVRGDMIVFSPAATRHLGPGQLVQAGLDPETFLPVPSLPQTLAPAGVPVYGLIEQMFLNSPLTRVQIRGARAMQGVVTSSDLWVKLREAVERHREERALFAAYWSKVDTMSHVYGPSSDTVTAEVHNLAFSFEREFLRRLSPAAREGTLFILTADHGQVDVAHDRLVQMQAHPDLHDRLAMGFTGDSRAAYLHCRQGEAAAARAYVEARLDGAFHVLDSQAALDAGLFGGGQAAPETRHRIGDLVLLARENIMLWDRPDPPRERGLHGSLTESEMLVPLIAARLDA